MRQVLVSPAAMFPQQPSKKVESNIAFGVTSLTWYWPGLIVNVVPISDPWNCPIFDSSQCTLI